MDRIIKQSKPTITTLGSIIGFGFLYFWIAKLSLLLAVIHPSASPIWPPTGIALAIFLLFGYRFWPAVFLGAFLVNLTTAGTFFSSLSIALGNTLEAILGTYLIHRFAHGPRAFERPLDVFRFAIYGGLAGPFVAATVGVSSLAAAGAVPWTNYWPVWFTWWMGDIGGAWVVAPLIITWVHPPKFRWTYPRLLEHTIQLATVALAGFIIFSGSLPYPYLAVPALMWSAIRFTQRETATSLLLLAGIAIWATIQKSGPFVSPDISANRSLLLLQLYIGIMTITNLIVAAEVQERTNADSRLIERERRFRALIEKSADAITLIDPNANTLYASPSIEKVLGYKPEEYNRQGGLSGVHPDDLAKAQETLAKTLSSPNNTTETEVRVKHKDGSWVWIAATVRNLIHDPAVGAIVVNFRDITERKRLEPNKNEFLMIAAHQLRAPLAAMRWNMELLLKETKIIPEKVKQKIKNIYDQNQIMIVLVNELLGVSRIIQGDIPNAPEQIQVSKIAQEVVNVQTPFAQKHGVTLTLSKHGTIKSQFLDPKRLYEVLQNVVANAIKYNKKNGTVEIEITQTKTDTLIDITDSGIGIPQDEQSQLFTKFFRASNAKAKDAEGAGLGLFVVKSYMDGWGGTINIESPPKGKETGTRIRLRIPFARLA